MLTLNPRLAHHNNAPAQSGVGIGLPENVKGDNTRAKACFLLSNHQHAFNGGLVVELLTKRRDPFDTGKTNLQSVHHQSIGLDLW
ncbi:hypothetical protein I5080_07745 [Salmonella enterica]|nr:hypothetical protein I5080_07745 [Salmonella enterica]